MKKFMFLLVLLLVGFSAVTGCKKGEKKADQAREKSTEQKIEEKGKAEDLSLTEKEVQSFIKACPVFLEITKKYGKEVERLADSKNPINDMKVLGEYSEYKEEMEGALKEYGFTFESFSSTFGKIMGTIAFGEKDKATEMARDGLKKMLDNPAVPEKSKEEVRKNLKELEEYEESEEGKVLKKNWTIVEKYEDELKELFEKD
jgi:hypothetical protein